MEYVLALFGKGILIFIGIVCAVLLIALITGLVTYAVTYNYHLAIAKVHLKLVEYKNGKKKEQGS
ncbi:hypothetical protein KAR91_15810 [Candidatus Pacearchaeota archaeon]|nr:hypothetical protein [Candidatus Pacearchaeota archaeon]